MIENIVFGIMIVLAIGAGVFTCIYEISGSTKTKNKDKNKIETKQEGIK